MKFLRRKKKSPGRRRPPVRGFSLMEVVASSTIMIVGLTGVVAATGTAINIFDKNIHITSGLHLSEQVLEGLLLRYPGHEHLSIGNTKFCFDREGHPLTDGAGNPDCTSSAVLFTTEWDVSTYTSSPSNPKPVQGLIQIDLKTSWTGRFGEQRVDRIVTVRR
jgi:Tfp pilus assembly protein PilV